MVCPNHETPKCPSLDALRSVRQSTQKLECVVQNGALQDLRRQVTASLQQSCVYSIMLKPSPGGVALLQKVRTSNHGSLARPTPRCTSTLTSTLWSQMD